MTTPEEGPCSHPGCQHHVTHPCECCGRQWGQSSLTAPEEGPLWTVHIPGGGIKKVRLPPLPSVRVAYPSLPESNRGTDRETHHHLPPERP